MKLRTYEIKALINALDGLMKGGNPQIIHRTGQDEIAVVPFKLAAAVYQWTMALQQRLSPIVLADQAFSQALFKRLAGADGTIKPGTPEMVEYATESEKADRTQHEFRGLLIPLELLLLEVNPGIAQYLPGLRPVLKMSTPDAVEEEPEADERPASPNRKRALLAS